MSQCYTKHVECPEKDSCSECAIKVKYVQIKEEYRKAYEDIPNLVKKTHLPMKVIREWSDCYQVSSGLGFEYIYKTDCIIVNNA